jgi:hypothetical protein
MAATLVPQTPNFTSAPAVGPEPPGLLANIRKRLGMGGPEPTKDPYDLTDQQCIDLLTTTKSYCEPGREMFEYAWWRAILYLLDRQWIYWNPTARQWNDKRLAKWIPKPVTNMCRTTVLSIRSTLQAITLGIATRPAGQDPKNVTTAQTVDAMEPLIAGEHDMEEVFNQADFIATTLGNCYLHPHWDKDDPSNPVEVEMWQCAACQAVSPTDAVVAAGQTCPECHSRILNTAGKSTVSGGKGKTLAVTPLELLMPIYAQKFDDVDRLIHMMWRPEHDVRDELDGVMGVDGKPVLANVTFGQGPQQRSLQLFRAMGTTSDLVLTPTAMDTGAYSGLVAGITEHRLWIKPCRTYPQGFYMRFLGDGQVVPIRPLDPTTNTPEPAVLPYVKKKDNTPLWPWIDYAYEKINGRLYAQGTVDVIRQKQDQLNQLDSMTQLVAQRMGNPMWLEEKGSEVERFTGEPGLIARWQRVGANGGKPERIPGENPPSAFFTMREQIKQDIEELAGTYDVLKGEKPSGVEAFSALNLLVERSQSRFTSLFKNRARAYRKCFEVQIELERTYGPGKRVQAVLGPNQSWTFKTFQASDLTGDIDILTEDGTQTPKTALGRRANLEHANQLGLIKKGDSEQEYSLLQELGLTKLAPSLDADVNAALQEQQAFEDWADAGFEGPSPLQVKPWQNDKVHLQENRKWMNGDKVRSILQKLMAENPKQAGDIEKVLAIHLQEHQVQMGQASMPPDPAKFSVTASAADLAAPSPLLLKVMGQAGYQVTGIQPASPAESLAAASPEKPGGASHGTSPAPQGGKPVAPSNKPGAAQTMANSNTNSTGTKNGQGAPV